MNITLLTYGSQGDVEPFLVLGNELIKSGHQVRLAAPGLFEPLARDTQISYVSLPGDPRRMVQDLVENAGTRWWRMVRAMKEFVIPLAKEVSLLARQASRGADLIIHSFLMTNTGYEIARELSIPDISLQTFPVFTKTGEFPAPSAPDLPLGDLYRRLTHDLVTQTFWQGSRIIYKQVRKAHPELPTLTGWPFKNGNQWTTPILYAFSPHVVPRPVDWPENVHLTGYLFAANDGGWNPDPQILEFLAGEPSPIAICFGSTDARRLPELINKLREAVLASGQRAVFAGLAEHQVDPDPAIYSVGTIPYSWLFKRASAVIHHGGAGTTGKSLLAGIPSIVLPFTSDQPFWGRQVHKLGAGPKPLQPDKVTARRLTAEIDQVMQDRSYRARAEKIGQRLREQDGPARAVELIENYAG